MMPTCPVTSSRAMCLGETMDRSLFPEESALESEVEALVALSLVPGIGPSRIRALMARLGSARAVFSASERMLATVPGIGPATARAIRTFQAHARVREQLSLARRAGARILSHTNPQYPRLLRETFDPPAFLWVRGTLTELDARSVAVVGTRRPTDYGSRVTRALAGALARCGITVVSGLAYGIDVIAHRAALDAGGRTIAVLGSGVDRIYPGHHARLAAEIVRHGALVSEYPMGAAPDAPNFPRRNRVISGFTLGTLVVEAYETGGALITADLALEQNREVFAVPSAIDSDAGRGTNRLIRDGHAKLTTCVEDVLEELGLLALGPSAEEPGPREAIGAEEKRLLELLTDRPLHIDVICERSGLDAAGALVALLSLEFKGYVRQLAGKHFVRSSSLDGQ